MQLCVCSRDIIYVFLIGKVSGLVENFSIGIFLNTINVINVSPCMTVLNVKLYLLITLSVTLALFCNREFYVLT